MGLLRLFLAISVIVGHTKPIYGIELMPAATAVWLFFVISGFYMQLILSGERYRRNISNFYVSRFLRLWPAFLVGFALCLLAQKALPWEGLSLPERTFVLIANVLMLFSDVLFLFHYSEASGWLFTFGSAFDVPGDDIARASVFVLNGPSWSIGLEIWFYLLVPLLARASNIVLWTTLILSASIRFLLELNTPWSSYFFFPANLCFFAAGMLAFRLNTRVMRALGMVANYLKMRQVSQLVAITSVLAIGLMVFREILPFYRNYPLLHVLTLWLSVGVIFECSKESALDRAVGELSYPIYILHAPIMALLGWQQSPVKMVLVTCVVAWLIFRLIEAPVDRYRHRKFR